jgi:hypothetical protein
VATLCHPHTDALDISIRRIQKHVNEPKLQLVLFCQADQAAVLVGRENRFDTDGLMGPKRHLEPSFYSAHRLEVGVIQLMSLNFPDASSQCIRIDQTERSNA